MWQAGQFGQFVLAREQGTEAGRGRKQVLFPVRGEGGSIGAKKGCGGGQVTATKGSVVGVVTRRHPKAEEKGWKGA